MINERIRSREVMTQQEQQEEAQRQSQRALALAQELAHPNTLALGYFFALLVALLMRDCKFARNSDPLRGGFRVQ